VTNSGLHHDLFLTRIHDRLLRGGLAKLADPANRGLRAAGHAYQTAIDDLVRESGLAASNLTRSSRLGQPRPLSRTLKVSVANTRMHRRTLLENYKGPQLSTFCSAQAGVPKQSEKHCLKSPSVLKALEDVFESPLRVLMCEGAMLAREVSETFALEERCRPGGSL